MKIDINVSGPVPIWRQIEDRIRRAVASGALPPGSVVPSVRELAVRLQVNPATVSKAYRHLVDADVLTVRRGEGTFVGALSAEAVAGLREAELRMVSREYVRAARALGATLGEATGAIETAWEEVNDG